MSNRRTNNPVISRTVQTFRTGDFAWPPAPETWSNRSLPTALFIPILLLFVVQMLAGIWAISWLPVLFGADSTSAERPIWAILFFGAALWFGYLVAPVLASKVAAIGPGLATNMRSSALQTALAVTLGVIFQLGVIPLIYRIVELFVDNADTSQQAQSLVDRVNNAGDVVLLAIIVVGLAPVVEEWFYRGFFLSVLAQPLGRVGAAAACSIVFALVHNSLILVPGLFAFSLALCGLTMLTGRLGPAVIAHMAFNATTLILLLKDGW